MATKTYRKATLPDLSERMRQAGATNEALARLAGVGMSTVATARSGVAIQESLAGYIESALKSYRFRRDPRGAR